MLPTIPNLPTDNLYKFMALAGLLMILVSTLFMELNFARQDTLIAQVQAQQKQIDFLNELVANSNGNEKIKYLDKAISISQENKLLIGELKAISTITSNHLNGMSILFGIGILLTITGFWRWYILVQKPLDEIMRLNLLSARKQTISRVPFRDRIRYDSTPR